MSLEDLDFVKSLNPKFKYGEILRDKAGSTWYCEGVNIRQSSLMGEIYYIVTGYNPTTQMKNLETTQLKFPENVLSLNI